MLSKNYVSGFAWVDISDNKSKDASNLLKPEPKIMLFQGSEDPKIPTLLCYCGSSCSPPDRDYVWGKEVKSKNQQEPCCSGTPYQHFKLALHDQFSITGGCEPAVGAPRRHDFSASHLVIDYLSAIRKEFMKNLVEVYQSHAEEAFTIDWIFTVPGLFDEVLIKDLREIYLLEAGFAGNITHITEPHAAAVAILSHSQSQLKPTFRWFPRDNSTFKVRIN